MNNYHPPLLENLRIHYVSVRLHNAELLKLNEERKQHAKGEWLCMCLFKNRPPIVPDLNIAAWKNFGEINHRLHEISSHLNAKQSCNPLTKTELFAVNGKLVIFARDFLQFISVLITLILKRYLNGFYSKSQITCWASMMVKTAFSILCWR